MEFSKDQSKQYAQIIAKAWQDDAYKQRLIENPKAVFEESGITVPSEITIKVMASTPELYYVALPARPEELSDELLDNVAGGADPVTCHPCWSGMCSCW